MRETPNAELMADVAPRLETILGRPLAPEDLARLEAGMTGLKQRAKTLNELAENATFYVQKRPLPMNDRALVLLTPDARSLLARVADSFALVADWTEADIEEAVRRIADAEGLKLGKVAQPLRAALTGSNVSPGDRKSTRLNSSH